MKEGLKEAEKKVRVVQEERDRANNDRDTAQVALADAKDTGGADVIQLKDQVIAKLKVSIEDLKTRVEYYDAKARQDPDSLSETEGNSLMAKTINLELSGKDTERIDMLMVSVK